MGQMGMQHEMIHQHVVLQQQQVLPPAAWQIVLTRLTVAPVQQVAMQLAALQAGSQHGSMQASSVPGAAAFSPWGSFGSGAQGSLHSEPVQALNPPQPPSAKHRRGRCVRCMVLDESSGHAC